MKFAIALLATLVLSGSGNILRRQPQGQQGQLEQQWAGQFPEINQPKIQERIFKDGNEYRYLYDGQILTGIPDINAQYSGARIRAVVKIQLGQQDLMQIEKVFVGSLHERFVSDPQALIQLDAFEPIPEQDAPFEEVLKKPVQFSFENGKIRDVTFVEDEPSWSINMKSAILATFHLSLTDRELPEDETRRPNPQANELRSQRRQGGSNTDNEEYFTVVEDGIGGRCEASYLILSIPDTPEAVYPIYDTETTQEGRPQTPPTGASANVLNVTKTFDYRNCEFRPFMFKGLHFSSPCPHCDADPESFFDMLESAAHTRYNITGNKQEYIIDSAVTEAVYKVTPRSHYAGSLVAYANVTTVLIASGPVSGQPIQFPTANANQIDGLHMIDAKFSKKDGDKILYETPEASRPIVQKPAYWPSVANKPQKVKTLFEKLVQGMSQKEAHTDVVQFIDEINRLLTYSSAEELEQIWSQIQSVSADGFEKEEVQHVFADLLVSAGTRCTFTFLKKIITEQKLKGSVVNDILALLPLKMDVNDVDQQVIEQMMELCQNGPFEQDPFTKRACWLSFGTLVHKACAHNNFDARVAWKAVENKYNGQQSGQSQQQQSRGPRTSQGQSSDEESQNLRCPIEFRQRVANQVASKLQSADEEEKILFVKTLGNMGLKETLDELEQAAEDESLPVYIRTQAIYAMRHIAPVHSEDVLEILLPLYRQTNNPTQVRIAAFVILLAAQPELPALQDVAQSLNREPDLDVASYVYSSLTTLANSTDPCLKNVTRDARLALETASPVNADWRHSKGIHGGEFIAPLKSGLFWELNTVMDKDTPAPRAANFRLHANVMKKSLDLFEVTFETEGFGDALRRFAGNFTKEHMADVLAGRAPRRPRQADVPAPEDLAEINQLLKFQPKEPKTVRGSASIKVFGQETRFVVINPQTVSRFLIELMTQSQNVVPKLLGEGLPIDNRRALLLLNTRVEFPTVLGVPIGASIRLPVFGGLKGTLKVQMDPKPQGGAGLFTQIPNKLTVESDVQTQIAGELHSKISVYLAFLKVGAGIRTKVSMNIPIDGKLEFNLQERMSKVTMDLPENPIKLVKLQSYPVTFVTRFSKNEQTYQPKNIQQRPQQSAQQDSAEESEEQLPAGQRRGQQQQAGQSQAQKYLDLQIQPVETDFVTGNGHVQLKKFAGLPVSLPELWEVPTPDFIKSRQVNFTIGHESMAYEINVNSECEYPDTRLAAQWLPTLASKTSLEIQMTPKKGVKKIVVSVFERSHFSVQSEKDLMTKLQDKVTGINIKDLSKPNTPKDFEKFAKLGHSLQILVNSEGSNAPDTWTTRGLFALIYSMDGRYVKTVAAMESKLPVLAKKMCLAGELRYPDRNNMWFVTPQETLYNKSVQGNLELSWGNDCGQTEKMVKLRLRIQKTEEQRDIEKHDLYDVSGVPVPEDVAHEVTEGESLFTSLFKQCQEDRQRGAFFSKECVDLAIRYSDLLRLKVDIEYKNVSRQIRRVLHRLEAMAKGIFAWNTDVEDVDVHNPENKINLIVEVSADRSAIDIKYQTPTQNVNMTNLDMPYNVQPVSALFPWSPARLVGLTQSPICTLSGPKINTFDDVSDEQPLSGSCWHVLTKDNSADDLFAVLVANVNKNSLAKKVAVLFKGHRIEIVPKSGQVPSGDASRPVGIKNFVVKYNGQELPDALTAEKRTTIPPNTPQDKQEVADIMLIKPETSGNSEPIVGVFAYPVGLAVLFDGSSVTVMPSHFWKGGVVGLCGPYNGQTWDDLLLPNKTMVDTAEEYSRAFMIQKSGCDATIPEFQARQKTRQ
jgi:hypothetical protein